VAKSDKEKPSSAYAVGYGKPPAHSRFQRGKSGNPNGRPKGTLNVATTLFRTLREIVVVNENGRRKEITKFEAALKQLVNKAASGDLRALNQLIGIMLPQQSAAEKNVPNEALNELDEKVALKILKRYEEDAKKGGGQL
jgi:uncharacterized protein DUF5681